MNKLRWLGMLMGITLVAVTGFQLYWLKQNYAREKKALAVKTELTFRETILQLQVRNFKIDGVNWPLDTGNTKGSIRIFTTDRDEKQMNIRVGPRPEMITSINILREKLKDSLRHNRKGKVMIRFDKTAVGLGADSMRLTQLQPGDSDGRGNRVFKLLYDVDSLQDSLRLPEIDSAYRKALVREKLVVPFSIIQLDSVTDDDRSHFNEATVGLTHPVTYRLVLGNTMPYLLRQIFQPILFSVFLLGLTIFSFVLLYRNLLRQRRLAELKNEFISNITHELKTPIATVGVAIEALKNFNAIENPERTREYLDISQNELQRLSLLVDKVLKLSMFEKKEIELKYEVIDLEELVNEVVASLKLQLEKHHVRVTVAALGDVQLQGDRLHLLSVIFNLLDNAIKYSKGDPTIQIDITERDQEVILAVTDNGIGIAPEYREKLFDKFFRVPHGDTHNAKGYGLGLSYAAQVVRKHQGSISVDSQPGIGSKFTIVLPKQQPHLS